MLQTVLTVLPVVTAGLYLLGLTYHQGFLEGFNIEESLFPLSVDRTLFQGFVAFMTLSAKPLYYSLIAAAAIFLTGFTAAVISSNRLVRRWGHMLASKLRQPSNRDPLSESAFQCIDKMITAFIYAAIVIFIYLGLFIVAVSATKSGKEQALHFIDSANKSKEGFVTLYLPNNTDPVIGKPILCSSSHCAYWLGNEAVLYRNESVERIVNHVTELKGPPISSTAP